MKLTLYLLAIALSSYLLGSINGAIITSKYIYKKDVRQFGSGNPGLTNFYRVFGVKGAALVLAIDILKSVIPAIFGGWLLGKLGMRTLGAEAAAFFVMVGHSFPAYYKFRGGKTVLAAGAALFVIDLRVAIASWVVFLCVMLLTRFVSRDRIALERERRSRFGGDLRTRALVHPDSRPQRRAAAVPAQGQYPAARERYGVADQLLPQGRRKVIGAPGFGSPGFREGVHARERF